VTIGAIDIWFEKHSDKTIFSLVQFEDIDFELDIMPKVYLATPLEIASYMKTMRNGNGNTSLKMHHEWKTGVAKGTVDTIPASWKFSKQRLDELIR
jgi:hypothetical protein